MKRSFDNTNPSFGYRPSIHDPIQTPICNGYASAFEDLFYCTVIVRSLCDPLPYCKAIVRIICNYYFNVYHLILHKLMGKA